MSNYGSISKIINQLLENVPLDEKEPSNVHHSELEIGHPSMAGKCGRQIWFASHTHIEDRHRNSVMLFGKLIHDWLEIQVATDPTSPIMAGVPVDFRPRYNMKGRVDFVSEKTVGELKTTKEWNIKRYLDAPREEHALQASIYAYGLDKPYIEIIYIARDTSLTRTFFWPTLKGIENEINRISEITKMHVPPDKLNWKGEKITPGRPWKPKKEDPWECRYCPFKKECLQYDIESR